MKPIITKLGNSNYNLDLQNNRIDFLDNRFYITDQGNYVPSVTTILSAYPKPAAFYDWLKKVGEDADTIRDEAGQRGSTVHKLTEDFDNGLEVNLMDENGYVGYKLSEWNMFERYVEFRRRFPLEIIHTELHLSSDLLGTAGTLDRVVKINGRLLIIDIKTSSSLYDHFWLQMGAYEKLLAEVQSYGRIIWPNIDEVEKTVDQEALLYMLFSSNDKPCKTGMPLPAQILPTAHARQFP